MHKPDVDYNQQFTLPERHYQSTGNTHEDIEKLAKAMEHYKEVKRLRQEELVEICRAKNLVTH